MSGSQRGKESFRESMEPYIKWCKENPGLSVFLGVVLVTTEPAVGYFVKSQTSKAAQKKEEELAKFTASHVKREIVVEVGKKAGQSMSITVDGREFTVVVPHKLNENGTFDAHFPRSKT